MALHLIKLCVGADSVEELRAWRAERARRGIAPIVPTRQTPKRAAELLEGGSLYWVIKGVILVRQKITAVTTLDSGPQPCRIDLAPELILTAPQPRRAFQGWRYLDEKDAPPDLPTSEGEAVPQELARQLREIGAW
ncbi:MAG TPA: DUF1489 domain-containing protein [Caulobacteraceae bacterium]|nr:DUF1489 domain-containing protein [Caulobacteraceae bacterium]